MSRQLALITGASAGIGRALAIEFALGGYDLILTARREERLQHLADEIEAWGSISVTVMSCDLSAPFAARDLHQRIVAAGLAVDVLVNNAAFGARGAFGDVVLERHSELLALNVTALTELCHVFLPHMLAQGRGGILNVASIAAFQAGPYLASYYASKAYVLSLSEALSTELRGSGVTVTCLAPGPTHSEFAAIAGIRTDGLFNVVAQTSEAVAKVGMRAFCAGRPLVVSGWINRLSVFMMRFLPRRLVRAITARIHSGG